MRAREVLRRYFSGSDYKCDDLLNTLDTAGFRILGPDDAKLIETALQHASFALDGVVALDDEDEGKDGGSDTCQHAKRTVDRATRALMGGGDGR